VTKSFRGARALSQKFGKWADAIWVVGMAAQAGFIIAIPVLAGLALGFWLDNQFNTLPFISLILTLAGGIAGPVVLYRWVVSAVKQRMERRKIQNEEKSE
jgi:predicted F0F1-ATPase subunit